MTTSQSHYNLPLSLAQQQTSKPPIPHTSNPPIRPSLAAAMHTAPFPLLEATPHAPIIPALLPSQPCPATPCPRGIQVPAANHAVQSPDPDLRFASASSDALPCREGTQGRLRRGCIMHVCLTRMMRLCFDRARQGEGGKARQGTVTGVQCLVISPYVHTHTPGTDSKGKWTRRKLGSFLLSS